MSEPSRDTLVRRIETAIEQGGLDEASRLIEAAERELGQQPELTELRRRLAVVESTLSDRGRVESAIRRAREEVNRANYHAALSVLEEAVRSAPDDGELRELIQQTTKAALRHEAAVERNRAVAQAFEQIGALIDDGDLERAAADLREANLRFGKHDHLSALQERLDSRSKEAELERTVAFVDQTRAFLDGGKWPEALRQAERILRLDPKNREALEMKQRARVEIERFEAQRQGAHEIEVAKGNVERLIAANELVQASRALESAVDKLGRHEVFEQVAARLDQAKAELQARKRLEWTQRRLKEADDLIRQSDRLSLQGRYEAAMERLRQARELHPDHPEIADRLQAARTAHQRAVAERQRAETVASAKTEIRNLLDGLRLDEAQRRIEAARSRFGLDDAELEPLATRLARLRESGAGEPSADFETASEALARQQELARAYSWKQTFLYALRGDGARALVLLVSFFLVLEVLAAWLPAGVGVVFTALRWLASLAVLGVYGLIVRLTFQGGNSLPNPAEMLDLRHRGSDLAVAWGLVLLAALPLLALVATRGWHGLFAGAAGWWLLAVLGWGSVALVSFGGAVAGAFGYRWALRPARHARALGAAAPETVAAVHVVFALVVVIAILRATLLPFVPWIGSPLAALVEAYALIEVPHVMGVVFRRHRIELAKVYR